MFFRASTDLDFATTTFSIIALEVPIAFTGYAALSVERHIAVPTPASTAAVKKLSVILKIAEALDITGFGNVTDISCDILGDSVIMKTIVKEDASFEINYSMLCGSEFKKAFGKNLEVL